MTSRARKGVALTSLGIALLSLEAIAIQGAAPHAAAFFEGERGRTLINATGVALRAMSGVAGEAVSQAAGNAVVRVLRGATEVYGLMLSVTPAAQGGSKHSECLVSQPAQPSACGAEAPRSLPQAASPADHAPHLLPTTI